MEELNSSGEAVSSEEIRSNEVSGKSDLPDGDFKHSMVNGLSNGYDKEKQDEKPKEHKEHKHYDKDRDKEKQREKDRDRDKHRSKDSDRDKHRDKHKDHKDRDREKEKNRDKEKDKERDKTKDRDREKDKDRDKSKHSSSSSSKDKHSSSSSSKDKDRDRDREKDKDKERKDKEKSRSHEDRDKKDKEHKSSSSSSKDKEHKSSSSSKHSSSSSKPSSGSSSKDKEHRDKDKERSKEKERDKEKDKSHDKEKEKSHDKERSKEHSKEKERDKEKEKSRDKDKDRHSSDKYKSEKDKHRDKDKDRRDKEKPKDKDREKSKDKEKDKPKEKSIENEVKTELPQIKTEAPEVKEEQDESFSFQTSIKEESSLDDDDDGKLMIKEEPTDDESKLDFTESSIDISAVKKKIKEEEEEEDEDDIPMAERIAKMKSSKTKNSRMLESEDEDDIPLSARKKPKKESAKKRKKVDSDYEDEEEDFKPAKKKKIKKEKEKKSPPVKQESVNESPRKKKKKEEEEQEVWKWWEEEKKPDGVKWTFLEHKGPIFAPLYEPLPSNVKFYYNGEEMRLSEPAEEVATFYARMLDHDYTTKEAFNINFMNDWRSVMTKKEQEKITDLSKCNFKHMHAYFIKKSEERKAMSKEEKKAIKEQNEALQKEYGFCSIDGHKEKIGNFKIEPPGLFRGRGEHPKMGKLKRRVEAEDIIINCSKGSKVPPPPEGHRWKEVRHDNTVTWLASWTENVQGQVKYIMLNPSSKLKGEKDWQKYETARKLAKSIDKIREDYQADFRSKEMRIRQRAVAMYFIDKLALRAGNEKDEDQADTVGCCSLRVEHITLHNQKDGKEFVVVFDFLGKDSIRYYNEVPVEKRVFKNLTLFMENKKGEDDLFDRLNTAVLNKHLSDLMEGLTAKVFRTYNASWTLQAQLKELTDPNGTLPEKILAYNRANRAVAILCNHQRAVPKTHDKSMANLREKLNAKREQVEEAEKNFKHAKRDAKNGSAKERINADKAKKTLDRLREQLMRLEVQETDREENKTIALGTSKLNYLDPRISVAWCKKYDIPIEKIYNKTQRDKFRWAIDMATADYVF